MIGFLLVCYVAESLPGVLVLPRSILVAQMACLALAFRWSKVGYPQSFRVDAFPRKATLSYSKALVAIISVLAVLGTLYRWPSSPPRPWKPGPRIFNAGIWTVHFGIDNGGRDSQQGITNLLRCVKSSRLEFDTDVDGKSGICNSMW